MLNASADSARADPTPAECLSDSRGAVIAVHGSMLTNPGNLNQLTHDIIGCGMRVHRAFGSGLLESTYEVCFEIELKLHGHTVRRRVPVPIVYHGTRIENAYWIDMLVDDLVIVELKCVERLLFVHKAQLLTYLRLANKPVGLLINFNEQVLKDGIKRVVNPECAKRPEPTNEDDR